MITIDHKGGGGSEEGRNLITRYLNSPLVKTLFKAHNSMSKLIEHCVTASFVRGMGINPRGIYKQRVQFVYKKLR